MIKKILLLAFISLGIVIAALLIALDHKVKQPLNINAEKLVEIKPGTTVSSFSKQLVKKNWLENRFWLRNYVRLHRELAQLKAGVYLIKPGMTSLELVKKIVKGDEHQFSITFIEGTSFKEWLSLLAEQAYLAQSLSNKSIKEIAAAIGINEENPEGWLFPDTYAFTAYASDLSILKRANVKMEQELDRHWQTRASGLPYSTPYQALIMASIIEKESGQVAELPLIASVFVNRLDKKMRLQTDPTVIYGLGEGFDGDIKRSHLKEKTPYNTYRINGLPPTPIAMPGSTALKAALNPASSDYLYFVSKGNGYHEFSTNLADHNSAVARYQLRKK